MERQEIQQYQILEALAREEATTQRQLADRLGVSLGLVNSFMKRMLRKGYFKITTLPARRVKYLLTPKGLAEKSRLAVEYLEYSLSYYGQMRRTLGSRVDQLVARGVDRVALVGTGELAELAFLALRARGLEPVAVASGAENPPENFMGHPVLDLEGLAGLDWQVALLAVRGRQRRELERLGQAGVAPERVVSLVPEAAA